MQRPLNSKTAEEVVLKLFNEMGIYATHMKNRITEDMMEGNGNKSLKKSIQIDGLAVCGKTLLAIEVTVQQPPLEGYVEGKIDNFNKLWTCSNTIQGVIQNNYQHLGIDASQLANFQKVTDYRILFVGPYVSPKLKGSIAKGTGKEYFWDWDQFTYFKVLYDAIKTNAQDEVLASLDLETLRLEKWMAIGGYVDCSAMMVNSSQVFDSGLTGSIVVFSISPDDLLKLSTVKRLESCDTVAYQRLPDPKRLPTIGKFITHSSTKFLNNLVVSLPPDTVDNLKKGTIRIPREPFSCPIIDGQHRLYGYLEADDHTRRNDKLIVTGLIFKAATSDWEKMAVQDEARIFLNINDKQKRVKRSVILGVQSLLLNEGTPQAHALRVLDGINQKPRPLLKAFALKTYQQGVPTSSLASKDFAMHFADKPNLAQGKGVITNYYQKYIKRLSNGYDYSKFYPAVVDDVSAYLNMALSGAKFPPDWDIQAGYSNYACMGGILRAFRYFRHENFYWNDHSKIEEAYSELVAVQSVPTIIQGLRYGTGGPTAFEKEIINAADRKHKKGLVALNWK